MVWSTIQACLIILPLSCFRLISTDPLELYKMILYSPSIRSIKCHLRFLRKNDFRKVNFYVFVRPILVVQNICFIDWRLLKTFFTNPNSQSILKLLFLIPSVVTFWNIWVLVKSDGFAKIPASLRSSRWNNYSKLYPLVLQWDTFSTASIIGRSSVQTTFAIFEMDIQSHKNFKISSFSPVVGSFSLFSFKLWTNWK